MTVNLFAGDGGDEYTLRHDWPADCFVQGGRKGVVLGKNPYQTAYFEAFPDTFIRGEGDTLEDAEDACWAKYKQRLACPKHEWETRGFTNGAGFCKHCGTFQSKVFTGEDLGQYCEDCSAPTTWSRVGEWWFCELHAPVHSESDIDLKWRSDNGLRMWGDPCNHDERCCRYHGTHSVPHKGCILR
jgi:hypothetical protein